MNGENIKKKVTNQSLPGLSEPSIIVMDNRTMFFIIRKW